ncbi:LysR family transcriptional regulator [Rhizobium sp. TH2]|nr:LysR family transcriptional regulator [Rhizobium sp. TH2]
MSGQASKFQLIIPAFSMKHFHMGYLDRRHYQLLIAVSRHRQLTRAADELGLTQPAASHQLREAERRLGVTLFKRNGRSMELTPAAERLLMAGLYAEDTLRKAELDAVKMDHNARPILRVALGNYDNVNWLAAALKAVGTISPDARIELLRVSNLELRNALVTGRADCFIAPHDDHFNDLKSATLFEDELVAIFPPGTPNSNGAVSAVDFDGWRYIAFQAHPSPGFEYERFFQRGEFIPRDVFQVETSSGIVSLVAAGLGASIMPSWCIDTEHRAGLVSTGCLAPEPLHVKWELHTDVTPTNGKREMLDAMILALRQLRPA